MMLVMPPSSSTGVTVFTNTQPFMVGVHVLYLIIDNNYTIQIISTRSKVGVHLDGDETNPTTSTTEAGLGFNLHYEQIKCN